MGVLWDDAGGSGACELEVDLTGLGAAGPHGSGRWQVLGRVLPADGGRVRLRARLVRAAVDLDVALFMRAALLVRAHAHACASAPAGAAP